MGYWDIQTLLAQEQLIDVTFQRAAKKMGFLNPLNIDFNQNINEGQSIQIPYYLSKVIGELKFSTGSKTSKYIRINEPISFSEKKLNYLSSNQTSNLRTWNKYIYDINAKNDQRIKQLQLNRFKMLTNVLQCIDIKIPKKCLTEDEQKIYYKGLNKILEINQWKEKKGKLYLDIKKK